MGAQSVDYILGHPENELDSVSVLSRAFEPFTRQLFANAGLKEGMRVLEMGSGGDVALLAAEFVGRSGEVVGIEPSTDAIAYAANHAAARGWGKISFVNAEDELAVDREFDALVGRIVLMFLPDPAMTLRRLSHHVVPGGLVIFQEADMSWAKSMPKTPAVEKAAEWMREIFRRSGADAEMGPKLHRSFKTAGLPDPQMRVDGLIYGSEGAGPALLAESVRAILPAIEQFGVATASEVDIDTLEDRIRVELGAMDATMSSPLLISAWARLPI